MSSQSVVADTPGHRLFERYRSLDGFERLMASIRGVEGNDAGNPGLLDVGSRYRQMFGWLECPDVLVSRSRSRHRSRRTARSSS